MPTFVVSSSHHQHKKQPVMVTSNIFSLVVVASQTVMLLPPLVMHLTGTSKKAFPESTPTNKTGVNLWRLSLLLVLFVVLNTPAPRPGVVLLHACRYVVESSYRGATEQQFLMHALPGLFSSVALLLHFQPYEQSKVVVGLLVESYLLH